MILKRLALVAIFMMGMATNVSCTKDDNGNTEEELLQFEEDQQVVKRSEIDEDDT